MGLPDSVEPEDNYAVIDKALEWLCQRYNVPEPPVIMLPPDIVNSMNPSEGGACTTTLAELRSLKPDDPSWAEAVHGYWELSESDPIIMLSEGLPTEKRMLHALFHEFQHYLDLVKNPKMLKLQPATPSWTTDEIIVDTLAKHDLATYEEEVGIDDD